MLIPKDIARKFGMDKPASIIVEETEKGILIRKVDLEEL
jgi:bifunctional DNA-binding transcriptional regulator/antitoxin component of YhaV-PrlF toxin-antitoxin module